jgi:DNA-binding MarR family transcriptional regulator
MTRHRQKLKSPNTVSRKELLVAGHDDVFRAMLDDLLAFSMRLQQVRETLAKRVDLTPPQYNMLMVLSHAGQQRMTISGLAERLRVSVQFVVQETGRLEKAGLLTKVPDAKDKRRVLLELGAASMTLLAEVAPLQVEVNDRIFSHLTRGEFEKLSQIARRLVASCEAGLSVAQLRDSVG